MLLSVYIVVSFVSDCLLKVYPQPSADAVDLLLMSKTERKKALARYSACPTTSSTRPSSTSTEHVRASFEPDLGFISYEPPSSPPHRKRNLSVRHFCAIVLFYYLTF